MEREEEQNTISKINIKKIIYVIVIIIIICVLYKLFQKVFMPCKVIKLNLRELGFSDNASVVTVMSDFM
jgi:hypothetical protein